MRIGPDSRFHAPLGMGGSFYGIEQWGSQEEADVLAALTTALDNGITHFDTATGYADGHSEALIGRFMAEDPSRRERIFLASKSNPAEITAHSILRDIDASRARLQTDVIDLYYIHWPQTGKDLRPWMEGLETARQQGKIRAVGVSNFSVEQMEQISRAGRIDAHQLGYNLLWRFAERDLIPYCVEREIAVVVYSALAHGILGGKYPRQLAFVPGDQRWTITLFRPEVWENIYDDVQALRVVADRTERSLAHLALRWLLHQPGVTCVLVSAKNARQAAENVEALQVDIPEEALAALTAISDRAMSKIPDEGNPFGHHP
jgi:myo-inositol catabolism protein IolS